jgi:hypothetical protein
VAFSLATSRSILKVNWRPPAEEQVTARMRDYQLQAECHPQLLEKALELG